MENIVALQEAFQIEVNAHHFYRRLSEAVDDPQVSDFFQNLSQMEREHAEELNEKYHIHLDEETFRDTDHPLPQPYFDHLCFFADTGDLHRLYNCAIDLEKGTLEFFLSKAKVLPEGKERELYLELAAEEREHIDILESERDR
jgi:rubrerythrin